MKPRRAHSIRGRRILVEQNVSNFFVLALVCLNAAFVFLRHDDEIDEDSPLIRYSASAGRRPITGFNISDSDAILGEHTEKFSVPVLRRHAVRGHGLQSFVLLGGYRTGPASFAAVGLAAAFFHSIKTVQGCRWKSPGHSINGSLSLHYPGDSHHLKYETLLFLCHLPAADLGSNGGYLIMTFDHKDMVALTEIVAPKDALPKRSHNISVCTPPIHTPLHPTRIRQWINFHRLIHGASLFVLYDVGGVDGALRTVLDPMVKKGWVEVHGVREARLYNTSHHAQVSVWTLFLSFDEYLSFPTPSPTASLPSLLEANRHIPWITFGSVAYSVVDRVSTQSRAGWAAEQLMFREELIHCKDTTPKNRDLCLFSSRLWKFVVNTKETLVVQTNRVMNPGKGGLNAPTSLVRVNRFPGLGEKNCATCEFWWEEGTSPPRLVRDNQVGTLAQESRLKLRKKVGWLGS